MQSPSYDRAVEHHRAGEFDKAIALYRHVLKSARGQEAARAGQMLGAALQQSGELEQAEEAVRAAVRAEPAPALGSRRALATMLNSRARMSDAIASCREAVGAAGKFGQMAAGEARLGLAIQLAESRRTDEALREIRALATEFANVAGVRYERGRLCERLGLLSEARAELTRVLELAAGMSEANILLARIDLAEGKVVEAQARLENLLSSAPQQLRGVILIELARVLDKAGAYAKAFEATENGQAINFGGLPPGARDGRMHELVMRSCMKIRKEEVDQWAKPTEGALSGDAPIFVVGFPRSGTTLVEQMLGSHPALVVSDEAPLLQRVRERLYLRFRPKGDYPGELATFSTQQIDQARRWYMELAHNALGSERLTGKRLVDKQPLNTIDLCFVRLLFPESPVVVVLRDPRDTVLSCYMQGFSRGVPHLFSLEGTAHLYARFMEVWESYKVSLGLKSLEVRYEDLARDPRKEAARLLESVGEPWNSAVLDFHKPEHRRYVVTPSYADVAQPVHTRAIGRWKNYAAQLEPVMPIIKPWVERLGYI